MWGDIDGVKFKLKEYDSTSTFELERIGAYLDPDAICTTFEIESDEYVSHVKVDYFRDKIRSMKVILNSRRQYQWGQSKRDLSKSWMFNSEFMLTGIYGSFETTALQSLGFIIYKAS